MRYIYNSDYDSSIADQKMPAARAWLAKYASFIDIDRTWSKKAHR